MAHLHGRITSVSWRDDFTGETLARIAPAGSNPRRISYAFLGRFAFGFVVGEVVRLDGEWEHSEHGKVFAVKKIERHPPTTRDGETVFLAGYIKGLSKKRATELLEHFGGLDQLIETCQKRPAALEEVLPRARKVRARLRNAQWERAEMDVDMFVALQSAGLRVTQVQQLVRFFGAGALRQIAQNTPYDFCQVPRVGFSSAEKVAKFYADAQGREVDKFNEDRLIYGLCEVVGRERNFGHVCAPEERIIEQGVRYLDLPRTPESESRLRDALGKALKRRLLVKDYDKIYSRGLHKAESDLSLHLRKLMLTGARPLTVNRSRILRDLEGSGLSDEQKEAVVTMATSPVSLLVGGPGRGKTRTLSSLVKLLEKHNRSYMMMAPTGKAAKRAAEVTGRECHTIHKACALDAEGDIHDKRYGRRLGRRDRFRCDVVIVDESSMIDLSLGFELIRRVKGGRTALVLVGDPDQLPPVSAGQVLKDLIASEQVPVARLTQVFRQAGGSPIVDGADAINRGELPSFQDDGYDVRVFDPTQTKGHPGGGYPDVAEDYEVNLIRGWLAKAVNKYAQDLGLDPLRDIQVYAPQKTGPLGLNVLNEVLQELLNPAPPGGSQTSFRIHQGFSVREGDKVMQVQNNYRLRYASASEAARKHGRTRSRKKDVPGAVEKEHVSIMNGQVGYVKRIDTTKREIEVRFEDTPEAVLYLGSHEWRQLAPAYAISIHRSQGSETPYAFIVLHDSMYSGLVNRPLIYTAWTRAKSGVAIFGPVASVRQAAENVVGTQRFSNLHRRLSETGMNEGTRKRIRMYVDG